MYCLKTEQNLQVISRYLLSTNNKSIFCIPLFKMGIPSTANDVKNFVHTAFEQSFFEKTWKRTHKIGSNLKRITNRNV